MATILDEIINNNNADLKKLKELKTAEEKQKVEFAKDPTKEGEYKTAQEAYSEAFEAQIKTIRTKINSEQESGKMKNFSQEVRERRAKRSMVKIEEDLRDVQGSIDILTLEIGDIDKQIEQVRRGLIPPPTN